MSTVTVSKLDRFGAWITRACIFGIMILMLNAQHPFLPF